MDETAQRVVDLWNKLDGWIPGAAYKELAEAIGVDPEVLLEVRKNRSGNTANIPFG